MLEKEACINRFLAAVLIDDVIVLLDDMSQTFDGVIVLLDDASHASLLACVPLLLRRLHRRLILVPPLLQRL